MVSDVNVLGPGVLDIVAAESNSTAVVTIQGNLIEGKTVVGADLLIGSRDTYLYTLLSHLNFSTINELAKQGLVRGLPKLKYKKYHFCSTCSLGKSKKHTHKPKSEDSIQEKLYLLHMDLCGPMRIESINGMKYILIIVDDYSRFTWVKILRSKDATPEFIIKFLKKVQVCLNATVRIIHTDNGTDVGIKRLHDDFKDIAAQLVYVSTARVKLVLLEKIEENILSYQIRLESLESRIVVHEKNEAVYEGEGGGAKDKTSLGYDSQMNKSEVVHSVFNSRENDVDDSPVNNRFKIGKGFHAVPPPYTGNYMPSRPDLSFAGLDDSVYKTKVSETETSISKTSKDIVEKPKIVRPSAPIIEEWDTDSDNDSVFRPKSDQTRPKFTKINFVKSGKNVKSVNKENTHRQVEYPRKSQSPMDNRRNWNGMMTQKLRNGFEFIKKACFVCGSFNHLIKDLWNNAQRVNHQNKLTHPHPKRNFVPTAVATKSGQVPVNAVKQSSPRAATLISTARPVNIVAPKLKVNNALPTTYSYFKAHSPGNPQYTLQDQGIFDSGCSRHMTGNKSFLTNYLEIDGGFVAFGESPKGEKEDELSIKKVTECARFYEISPFKNAFTLSPVLNVTPMDDTGIFGNACDDEDVGAEADLNNLETTMNVSPILTTRINKDHPKDQIIGDFNLAIQTRRMTKISNEHAMMDVKSAFLYGTIDEEVYVCQPLGFEDPQFPDKVYKVEKTLYGLHQAPRAWYETLSTYLIENGFRKGTIDKTLFIKKDKCDILFQMSSIGELTFFLGLQVQQKKDGIFISQDKYVADILKKFDFTTVKTASTPMEPNKALVKDKEADSVDVNLYRSMIGSLMYLIASGPDITFAVCAYARFQVTPKTSHLHAMKRIFRYLKGQPKLGLWYLRDLPFDLEAFSDSDYAGASLDRKSTIGGCQFLSQRLISWQCKKQTIVANSTIEAEYVAAVNCCGQGRLMVYKCSGLYTSAIWIEVGRVKHGKKLVSAARLTLCCWKKLVLSGIELVLPGKLSTARLLLEEVLLGTKENADFHQILDFLTSSSINFSLTVSPTIYASYIEQFWNTACVKTINSKKQIRPNVDGKDVVVSESLVRRDLHLNDEDGTACLTTNEIFKNLALMGYEPASDKLTFYKGLFSPQWKECIHVAVPGSKKPYGVLKLRLGRKSDKIKPMFKDSDFDRLDDDMENVEGETVYAATSGVSTAGALVSTARPTVSTAGPSTSAAGTSTVVITDTEQEQRRLTTPPPSKPSDTRDKGKGIMVEPNPPVKIKRSDQGDLQLQADSELAQLLHQEELAQVERRQRERAAQEEVSITALYEEYDTIQASIDYSEKEENKLVEPESEGKKGKIIKRVANSTLKQKSSKKQKMMQEQESAKSDEDAAADYEHEQEELRMWLTVVPDEEETVDPEILSDKYPIVDWESQNLGNVDMEDLHVYKIIRADGNTSYHKSLFSMLRKFDRQDLVDLHRLVMKRFEDNTPEVYYIADGWYFNLLQHVSREKVSYHQGNAGEDVKLEAKSLNTVMSDSEDFTVTYTAVSSPFGGLLDIGSPRVDGPPVIPEDPYAYVVAAFQAPPSPNYVSGPEYPPSPEFIPEPVYPEFMPPEDDVLPDEEQPLPAAVSPTADSPGYVLKSDPEEDPEEDDDEDPKQNPANYPADGGDDGDDEDESSDDDEDDVASDDDEDDDVAILLAIPTLPPSLLSPWSPPLPQILSPPLPPILSPQPVSSSLPVSPPLPLAPPSLPVSPTYPLGYKVAMIWLRAEAPSTSHSPPSHIILSHTRADTPPSSTLPSGAPSLLPIPLPTSSPPLHLLSTDHRANRPEVTLLPRKREIMRDLERDVGYGITDTWDEMLVDMPGAPATDDTELGRRMTEFATRVRQDT
ncbi:putative ribonuclease H-like domain-containing protein, partial [Tanacetum coccineum]